MALEITELLREKLNSLSCNPNLKSEADKSISRLDELQELLKSAVSIQGSDTKTNDDRLKLLQDIYFVEDRIEAFLDTMALPSHKGFNMMNNYKSFVYWWGELLLRKNIRELSSKVKKHIKIESKALSSYSETSRRDPASTSKEMGDTIGESSTDYSVDVQVSLEFSLRDFVDVQAPLRKSSNDSDDKRLSPSQNEEVENDAILPISFNEWRGQQWTEVPNYVEEKPVIIVLDDLVKKLSQPVLSRCKLQFLISMVAFCSKAKAILLWVVYNSEDIKQYFQCSAWVTVFEGSKATDILEAVLKQVMPDEKQERQVDKLSQEVLHDFLVRRRYLVVLYGALTASIWNDLKLAFPFSFNGSRVILAIQDTNDTIQSSSWILGRDHPYDSRKMKQQFLEENGVGDDTNLRHASEEWPQSLGYLEDDSRIIGIKAALSKLQQSILSPDRLLFLISIVGVDRFGTSTLLWKMYDAEDVKKHFEFRAWVHVQEDFNERDVLAEIWKQVDAKEDKLPVGSMREMLCKFLARKRYLIVLCDVWTSGVWESLKNSLPNSLTGSRVILTVHNADVARQTNSWIFQMTPGRELLLDLKDRREDALDEKVAERWNSDIMDNESGIIGMKDKIEELAKLALKSYRLHFLISVIGVAGSGKTTLVRPFYNSIAAEQHFDCRAWITVQQEYDEKDLLDDLLGQLRKTKEKQILSLPQLRKRLQIFLNWKRYLIVLDDVQTDDIWKNTLSPLLPNSSNGSRVILTIRKAYLAYHMNRQTVVLQVDRLNEVDGWKLFSKKAQIPVDDNDMPLDLKNKILQRCGGLPISIVLLGGLLSTKEKGPNYDGWSEVIEQPHQLASSESKQKKGKKADQSTPSVQGEAQSASLVQGEDQSSSLVQEAHSDEKQKTIDTEENSFNTLDEYYMHLGFPLKYCLLYLSLFPKSYEIPIRRLLLLWLAEGLIQPEGDTTPAELAWDYFRRLEIRNMVEIVKRSLDGRPKTCRLPNALYDALSTNAEKFGFFHVHRSSNTSNTTQYIIRRLAEELEMFIHTKPAKYCVRNLRSYISFYKRKGDTPTDGVNDFLKKIVKEGFGMLVVLDLEGVYKPAVSETLGKLPYLKYLGLRRTHLDSVPESVGELLHLQTLDVKQTNVISLPDTIWEAKKLQHLYMSEIYVDLSIHKPFDGGSLNNLHTLWGLKIRGQIPKCSLLNRIDDVRKLKLTCYEAEASVAVLDDWLSKLKNLQSLKLRSASEKHEPSKLPLENMGQLQRLSKLYLFGELTRPIDVLGELPKTLTVLTLSGSYLREDPMEKLAELKELKVLRLYAHSVLAETMTCHRDGFPKLRVLKLWNLPNLQEWIVEDRAMPVFECLEIRSCNQLERVDGLETLTTLKELTLTSMKQPFVEYVEDEMGSSDVSREEKSPGVVSFKRIKKPGQNGVSK